MSDSPLTPLGDGHDLRAVDGVLIGIADVPASNIDERVVDVIGGLGNWPVRIDGDCDRVAHPVDSDTRVADVKRPRLLDLFCGAGGAAVGYHRAGFDVTGVDIVDQPDYPFTFHQADAMTFDLDGYDAIHASPPCQAFTQMSARWRGKGGATDDHIDLLTPTRTRFAELTVPWIIENVPGAKHHMASTLTLHGGMFGLGVHRPRLFESNVLLLTARYPHTRSPVGVYGKPDGRTVWRYRNNGNLKGKSLIRAWKTLEEGADAMGIDWMTGERGLRDAIPPAYTEHIGHQLIGALCQTQD